MAAALACPRKRQQWPCTPLPPGRAPSTAVVYASELAPPGWEGRHGAFMVASCQAGLLAGEIAVMISEPFGGQGAVEVP
jgi:hypothetical protein